MNFHWNTAQTRAAILALSLLSACGARLGTEDGGTQADGARIEDGGLRGDGALPDSGLATTPTVLSTEPLLGATDVPLNASVRAVFSEPMDAASLSETTFTVTSGEPPTVVSGTVLYSSTTAVFWPRARLLSHTVFTGTITTGALSARGVSLAADHVWTFTTGETIAPGLPVNLGMAGGFALLAKSGISTVPESSITGDVGLSPAAATFITGFSLDADATNTFARSTQVIGSVFAANYAVPTPANLTVAVLDMEHAFTDAASRAPDVTELGAGLLIDGTTLAPGVYRWGTGLSIPTSIFLEGSATDVWIFQIGQDLTMASGASVHLTGGALPQNVFWQVAGYIDLGTTAHCEGVMLSQTAIALNTGASVNGRLFAQTAITIEGSTIVQPSE